MKIELDTTPEHNYRIDAYETGLIIVNGTSYSSSLILTPDKLITNWAPKRFADLALQHIEQIAALDPEIIILGTGQKSHFLDQKLITPIHELKIGFEIMDTGAACRCYNVLNSEGRKVAAALLPIEIEYSQD